jgi:hypothetical protein
MLLSKREGMEFFVPSLFIMLIAMVIILGYVVNASMPSLLAAACLFFVLAVYAHATTFPDEYRMINPFSTALQVGLAPYLMSGFILVLLIGYLLLMFAQNKMPSLGMPAILPSAASATNFITKNINYGLSSMGAPSKYTTPEASPNAGRNMLASAVNYRV